MSLVGSTRPIQGKSSSKVKMLRAIHPLGCTSWESGERSRSQHSFGSLQCWKTCWLRRRTIRASHFLDLLLAVLGRTAKPAPSKKLQEFLNFSDYQPCGTNQPILSAVGR